MKIDIIKEEDRTFEHDLIFLDDIFDELKRHEGEIMQIYPLLSSDLEFLEHFLAKYLKRKCEGCGKDFGC